MAQRKTIAVEEIRSMVNWTLATSHCDISVHGSQVRLESFRRAQAALLEDILMKTGNYRGFRYLAPKEVPTNALPGIRPYSGQLGLDKLFENTDSTRVEYL